MEIKREVIYEFVDATGQPVIRKIDVTEEIFKMIIDSHSKATEVTLKMNVGGRVSEVLASELHVLH